MRSTRAAGPVLLFAGVSLLSRAAWACPTCLSTGRGVQLLKLGSLFMLLPFAVVALVLYVLRQAPPEKP